MNVNTTAIIPTIFFISFKKKLYQKKPLEYPEVINFMLRFS